MAIATDGCNVTGRHNVEAQKLETRIKVWYLCIVMRTTSDSYYTAADFYSMG